MKQHNQRYPQFCNNTVFVNPFLPTQVSSNCSSCYDCELGVNAPRKRAAGNDGGVWKDVTLEEMK